MRITFDDDGDAVIECDCGDTACFLHVCHQCGAELPEELIKRRRFINRLNKPDVGAGYWE
jgi:hypothetical protein